MVGVGSQEPNQNLSMPPQLEKLLEMQPASLETQIRHGWNPYDAQYLSRFVRNNIFKIIPLEITIILTSSFKIFILKSGLSSGTPGIMREI